MLDPEEQTRSRPRDGAAVLDEIKDCSPSSLSHDLACSDRDEAFAFLRSQGFSDRVIAYFKIVREPHVPDEVVVALAPREPTMSDLSGYTEKTAKRLKRSCADGFPPILFPCFDQAGKELPGVSRIRFPVDAPKYVGATGIPPHPYFSRAVDWAAVASDPAAEPYVGEGEIDSAIACSFGYKCIGNPGVDGHRSKAAGFNFPPQLEKSKGWKLEGQLWTVVYDSDISEKPGVQRAQFHIATELGKRGAIVRFKTLPSEPDGKKNGLGDFLLRHGRAALDALPFERLEKDAAHDRYYERYILLDRPVCAWDTEAHNGEGRAKGAPLSYPDFFYLTSQDQVLDWSGNKPVKKSAGELYVKSGRANTRKGIEFDPSFKLPPEILNLAQGFACEPKRNGAIIDWLWKPFNRHVASEREDVTRYLEQFAAYPVAHPGVKQHHGVAIHGASGAGKSLWGLVAGAVYHPDHSVQIEELTETFNEDLDRKQFILADEINVGHDKRGKMRATLKNLITRAQIRINGKFERTYRIRDCINWVLTSNDPDMLWLDDDDRRWFIIEVSEVLNHDFGKCVFESFCCRCRCHAPNAERCDTCISNNGACDPDEGRAALLYYFQNQVDFTGYDPFGKALNTEEKRNMIELGRSDLDAFVHEVGAVIAEDAAKRSKPDGDDLRAVDELAALFHYRYDVRAHGRAVAGSLNHSGSSWSRIGQFRVGGTFPTIYAAANAKYWRAHKTEVSAEIAKSLSFANGSVNWKRASKIDGNEKVG